MLLRGLISSELESNLPAPTVALIMYLRLFVTTPDLTSVASQIQCFVLRMLALGGFSEV